jgi:hypothetical protein
MIPFNRNVNKVVTDTTSCVCALWVPASCVSFGPTEWAHPGGDFMAMILLVELDLLSSRLYRGIGTSEALATGEC